MLRILPEKIRRIKMKYAKEETINILKYHLRQRAADTATDRYLLDGLKTGNCPVLLVDFKQHKIVGPGYAQCSLEEMYKCISFEEIKAYALEQIQIQLPGRKLVLDSKTSPEKIYIRQILPPEDAKRNQLEFYRRYAC